MEIVQMQAQKNIFLLANLLLPVGQHFIRKAM